MSLKNLVQTSKKSNKLDYTIAFNNQTEIIKLLSDDNFTVSVKNNSDSNYNKFKNLLRYNFVSALTSIEKNNKVDKSTQTEINKVLKLTGFNVAQFKKWLTEKQIKNIDKLLTTEIITEVTK